MLSSIGYANNSINVDARRRLRTYRVYKHHKINRLKVQKRRTKRFKKNRYRTRTRKVKVNKNRIRRSKKHNHQVNKYQYVVTPHVDDVKDGWNFVCVIPSNGDITDYITRNSKVKVLKHITVKDTEDKVNIPFTEVQYRGHNKGYIASSYLSNFRNKIYPNNPYAKINPMIIDYGESTLFLKLRNQQYKHPNQPISKADITNFHNIYNNSSKEFKIGFINGLKGYNGENNDFNIQDLLEDKDGKQKLYKALKDDRGCIETMISHNNALNRDFDKGDTAGVIYGTLLSNLDPNNPMANDHTQEDVDQDAIESDGNEAYQGIEYLTTKNKSERNNVLATYYDNKPFNTVYHEHYEHDLHEAEE